MPSENVPPRLRDIADRIVTSSPPIRKNAYAVVRALEIVSEASRRLPAEIRDRHPGIVAAAAAAKVYRHEYKGADFDLIRQTVKHDLGFLLDMAVDEPERPDQLPPGYLG